MFTKNFSLTTAYRMRYTINGLAWLAYAVLHLFSNKVCNVLSAVALVIAILCAVMYLKKGEAEDEMAVKHLFKAKAYTQDMMYFVFLIVGLVSLLGGNLIITVNYVYGFVIAFTNFFTGILFAWFEKVGD